jgi:hypothetical protein
MDLRNTNKIEEKLLTTENTEYFIPISVGSLHSVVKIIYLQVGIRGGFAGGGEFDYAVCEERVKWRCNLAGANKPAYLPHFSLMNLITPQI